MKRLMAGMVLSLIGAADASAQTALGAAVVVARLPSTPYVPGAVDRPPNGLVPGAVLFGAATLTPRLGVQGEMSLAGELTTESVSSHPGFTIEGPTRHRDTILSGLLRVRAAPWCEVFVGGGLTFERTEVRQTIRDHFTGDTSPYDARSSSATRATFTTGVDLPIPLYRGLSLLPTGRVHVIARHAEEPTQNTRPLAPPSRYAFRLGIGGRVEF